MYLCIMYCFVIFRADHVFLTRYSLFIIQIDEAQLNELSLSWVISTTLNHATKVYRNYCEPKYQKF